MTSSPNTGPIVPGWIRDEIARHEQTWPRWTLAAALAAAMIVHLAMGALLWTSDAVVYYARP
jgi:hypothetical protein